jgi:tetratricopeptide (TPR) repeat protein
MRFQETVLGLCLLGLATAALPQDGSLLDKTPQHQALDHYRAGQELMHHEHYEAAVQEFKTATELEPMMMFAYYAMGRAQMAMKDYGQAVQSFKGCDRAYRQLAAATITGSLDPGDNVREQIFDLQASQFKIEVTSGRGGGSPEAANQMARMQNTIDDLSRLREGLSSGGIVPPAECMLSMGSSLIHLSRLPDAEQAFKSAIQGRPRFGEAHNNLAVVLGMQGREKEALEEVRLAEKYKFKVQADFKRHLAALHESQPAKAPDVQPLSESAEAAALHDDTPRLSYPQLTALFKTDPSSALLELAATPIAQIRYRLEQLHVPGNRQAVGDNGLALGGLLHTQLAFLQLRKGVIELANENLGVARELMDLVKDQQVARTIVRPWFLAVAHEFQSRILSETADRLLKEGLQRFPNDPRLLMAEAAIHEASLFSAPDPAPGLRDVEKEYRRILEADPESEDAHLHLGRVLGAEGRFAEAQPMLLWARAHGHQKKELYLAQLFLGGVAEGQGRLTEAAAAYRAALEEDPEGQSAVIGLSHTLGLVGAEGEGNNLIQRSLAAHAEGPSHVDPWWPYIVGLLTDGDETWDGLRALLAHS